MIRTITATNSGGARLCFLLLLLVPMTVILGADDSIFGGNVINRTAANTPPGNLYSLLRRGRQSDKLLPVYLEIGGLDRHWKEAGISWRVEAVLPEEANDGLAAADARGHTDEFHADGRMIRRQLQRDRFAGGVAAADEEGLIIDDRDRMIVFHRELQQILRRGFKDVENEKLKRHAGDSPTRDAVARRQNEAEFADRTAPLKLLEKIKTMGIEDARRSRSKEKLAPIKERSLQTRVDPQLEGTMTKDMRREDGQRERLAKALSYAMEEGSGSSHEEQMDAWKTLKLEFLEAFVKKQEGTRSLGTNKSFRAGFAGDGGEGAKKAKLSSRRTLEQVSRELSARHLGIVGTALNRPADRQLFSAGRASAFLPASDTTQHQILDQHGAHVMYRFLLAPYEQQYRLILETAEDPKRNLKTATTKNSLPVGDVLDSPTAFVLLTVGDRVSLLRSEGLDLSRGTTLTFDFSVTSQQLQQDDRRDLGDTIERPTFPPREEPATPTRPPPQTPRPAAQTTPSPVPLSTPVTGGGNNNGGGGGNNGGAAGVTPAPSTSFYGGPRPPFLGGLTDSPSISAAPSFSPTVEPLCVSQTNGPVIFDGLFWAIRLARNNVNGGLEELLGPVLSDLAETYTAVATCDQKGAFRTMSRVDLIEIHEGGTTSSEVEIIVQLFGSCEGCNTVPVELFRRTQESVQNVGENRRELANPCVCPGPSRVAFMKAYNFRNQTTALGDLLDVVDVYRVANCTPGVVEDLVQQHTALVSVFLSRDPEMAGAEVSTEEQDTIIANFLDSFHEAGSFAEGTCDLARRNILTVLPDDANTKQQRNRRLPSTAQTSDDVELHLLVTFECYGCNGQLFGKVDVQNSTNCLCPVETTQQGVRDRGLIGPLTEALQDVLLDSGGTQDIAISQFVPDMGILTITQVADVMQMKEVDCGSSVSVFTAVVVVEYDLIPNITDVSDDDIALLETQFVKGYNGLARRYCDPFFRRLSSAEALFYKISNDGTIASFEFSVVGTCRGDCNETIPVYDPEAFRRTPSRERKLAWKQHRTLRNLQQFDPKCYCSATSSVELGPSEPEVVQNYQALVNRFELETIGQVSDCRFLTFFRSAVVLNISGSVETSDQLSLLGQTFVDSYNQAISEGLCDSLFRQLTDFEISSNVTITEGNVVNSTDQGNRKLWTRILLAPERRAQLLTLAPTFAPTVAPTGDLNQTSPVDDSAESLVLLEVSGTCRGCSSDSGLFDQTSGRRRSLQEDGADSETSSGLLKARVDSCFCPPTSTRVEPTQDQVLLALSSLPFIDKATLEEVRIVPCAFDETDFSTTIVIDAYVSGDVTSNDEDLIGSSFISEFTQLSADYCDELFRRPETVLSIDHETLAETDGNGFPRVRFFLKLGGSCRGCRPNGDLFDDRRNRRLDHLPVDPDRRRTQTNSDICFCPGDAPDRAIREDEFQDSYAEVFASRRKLQGGQQLQFDNTIILAWVGQLTRAPSLAALDTSILNFLKYPNCVVPAGTEHYIGDGFCDSATIPNTNPPEFIYNVLNCGYDGGDCCASECQTGLTYVCGQFGYVCHLDNFADTGTTISSLSISECSNFLQGNSELLALVGNGICNDEVNVFACAYDDKDCCESTCRTLDGANCTSAQYYNCVDPTASERTGVSNVCPTISTSKAICTANPFCQPTSFCGDGWCDSVLNNAACGYDGGDCCKDTCMLGSSPETCGVVGYPCVDPCSNSPSSNACNFLWIGDGWCDFENNNAACNYDGGDCCPYTCDGFFCGWSGYDCQDPDVLDLLGSCNGFTESIGDGFCDDLNNNADCVYDGGDCCATTCNAYSCGWSEYDCQDPDALDLLASCNGFIDWIGDGFCNFENNDADCAYDGGDCCATTCSGFMCGWPEYDCQDPDVLDLLGNCNGFIESIGDGECDFGNNNADCAYDGGDCCATTCSGFLCGWSEYDCQDPAELTNPLRNCRGYIDLVGDGWCYGPNNNADCEYDGGDCCESTCNPRARFTCGVEGYRCCDPSQTSDYLGDVICVECPALGGVPEWVGDGWCDSDNNVAECEYDGGDCCKSTCDPDAEFECGAGGYSCCDSSQTKDYLGYSFCVGCPAAGGYLPWIGDGWCDSDNNNAECGYDGGDCCQSTCDPNAAYVCGVVGYACCDSLQKDYRGEDFCKGCEAFGGYLTWIGDGDCDDDNNIAECEYDGGDCCKSTCKNAEYDCTDSCCDTDWCCDCLDPCASESTEPCPASGAAAAFVFDTTPPTSMPSESSQPSPEPTTDNPSSESSTDNPSTDPTSGPTPATSQ